MAKRYIMWSIKNIVTMICNMLENKFDCLIIIEGNRGLGKSTFAYVLARRVRTEMKNRGVEGYKFNPRRDLLYKRDEVIEFFNKWKRTGIADEMINVTFNRDFYNNDQKDLIKMINMNRDHNNLFIACVPQFATLDTQVKQLAKLRLTVTRRGLAILQTPTRSIYSVDRWDSAVNGKIERRWLEKGVKNPKYTLLTTFRGFCKFPKLNVVQEALYQEIKNKKRGEIYQEKHESDEEDLKKQDPFEKLMVEFEGGKIRDGRELDGYSKALGIDPDSLKSKMRRRLKKECKPQSLTDYYYDNRTKKEKKDEAWMDAIKSVD